MIYKYTFDVIHINMRITWTKQNPKGRFLLSYTLRISQVYQTYIAGVELLRILLSIEVSKLLCMCGLVARIHCVVFTHRIVK